MTEKIIGELFTQPQNPRELRRCGRLVQTLRGCPDMQFVKETDERDKLEYAFFSDPQNGDYVAGAWQCSRCHYYFPDIHADEGKRPFEYVAQSGAEMRFCATCHPLWRKDTYEPALRGQRAPLQVPPEYMSASPVDLGKGCRDVVMQWPAKPFIMLTGECGRGKTHAMWVVAKNVSEKGQTVKVHYAPSMRATWIAEERKDQLESAWTKLPLLMIDDLTSAAATDGWLECIRSILNSRIERHLPTFITSSSGVQDIAKTFGSAFASRLNFFRVYPIVGVDRRKPQ